MTGHTRGQLRAGDSDRDAIAERLAAAMSEGRLAADEYHQRLDQAYAAKTYADLDRLLADLPAPPPQRAPASPRAGPVRRLQLYLLACARCCASRPLGCLILTVLLIAAILP